MALINAAPIDEIGRLLPSPASHAIAPTHAEVLSRGERFLYMRQPQRRLSLCLLARLWQVLVRPAAVVGATLDPEINHPAMEEAMRCLLPLFPGIPIPHHYSDRVVYPISAS